MLSEILQDACYSHVDYGPDFRHLSIQDAAPPVGSSVLRRLDLPVTHVLSQPDTAESAESEGRPILQ